ncbi:HAD-IA family hydrolase [Variovorax dokdonensis]|uniref:HAD-IA family hydrolase n=1 Tax=Variovorax dokdonensis TaxID=344883 RepID=A0ABT7N8G9_9BURK|nr:HAD-IA family hydrolase [Variovorax dokdonensis]MDM0044185.1 HAD-IA family hydrolase [Variovorax dokdonensis]
MASSSLSTPEPFDASRVRAISLDLDDTLWPIWPTIERAEKVLHGWLEERAPGTARMLLTPGVLREIRQEVEAQNPQWMHDMSAMRRESIRVALLRAGDDPALAPAAFEAFFAERQRVTLYEDVLPSMEWLAARYPMVAISNGNANIHETGVGHWFKGAFSAREFGQGKPAAPIFHAAAASLDVAPSEVLHVGDDAALDVVGALEAGMQAAWLVRDARPWEHERRPHLVVPDLHALCKALGAPGA